MLDLLLQALTAFVVVIDPLGLVPVFIGLSSHLNQKQKRHAALKASIIAGGVLVCFFLWGSWFLGIMSISLPAFRIAGGVLLLLLAVDMLLARPSGLRNTTPQENQEAETREDISVFPLAIPLMAGPGAMTSVVLLATEAGSSLQAQALVLAVLLGVLVLTLLLFIGAATVARVLGVTGTNVISRVLGIILAALACQFMIDGIRQAFL